ncbi:TRAP transporter small permease [Lachnospiraceae bacterium 62-35]
MHLIDKTLDIILQIIMAVSSLSVMLVSTLQVISRFITQLPIGWSTDVLRMSFIYAVFSGAAYCAKLNSHINLDVVLSLFSDRIRKVMETIIFLAVTAFCCFVAVIGIRYAVSGLNQNAPFLPVKMTWFYAAVPVSFIIMTYYYLGHFINGLKELMRKKEGMDT